MTVPVRRSIIGFLASFALAQVFLGSGCIHQAAMRGMMVAESKSAEEVLAAAQSVIKERYYQTRVYRRSNHIVALSPIELEGNYPVRRKIDVWVFQENGYWMPKVFVRRYIDLAEPPRDEGGPIVGRFPMEVTDQPLAADDWHPLMYDRTEEEQLRNAILERLRV